MLHRNTYEMSNNRCSFYHVQLFFVMMIIIFSSFYFYLGSCVIFFGNSFIFRFLCAWFLESCYI